MQTQPKLEVILSSFTSYVLELVLVIELSNFIAGFPHIFTNKF